MDKINRIRVGDLSYSVEDLALTEKVNGICNTLLSDNDQVNDLIKDIYADIDYTQVKYIQLSCARLVNEKYYNGIYLYDEGLRSLALFERNFPTQQEAIEAFGGTNSMKSTEYNKKYVSYIGKKVVEPFHISTTSISFKKPINIMLTSLVFNQSVSTSISKDPIINSAIRELFIDNKNNISLPPLYVVNLRKNYNYNDTYQYGMLLCSSEGDTYFSFGTTDSTIVDRPIIELVDTKKLGIKAYVVIDWDKIEENKQYMDKTEPLSSSIYDIFLQPFIYSYFEFESVNKDLENKVSLSFIPSGNLYNKDAVIFGQAISFSNAGNGSLGPISTSWSTGATSDYIPIVEGNTYYLHRGKNDLSAAFCFLKEDKKTTLFPLDPITEEVLPVSECVNKSRAYKAPKDACYAIFTIVLNNATVEKTLGFQFELGNTYTGEKEASSRYAVDYQNLPYEVEYRYKYPDKLWGKKWVACGDSFTAGDFSGDTTGDYLFSEGRFIGKKKVYPYFIGLRNNMTIVNEAIGGSIIALSKAYLEDPENVSINTRSPFSYQRYKEIPKDADYITLWFGINDSVNTNLGTISDTTNETFYGAWNVVLEYLITNHPFAKIGIIITNGGKAEYRQAERDIAKKWGIPFLDMMGDEQVPPIFGRESSLGFSSVAHNLRSASFRVSESNGHPNQYAHEYQSTFIEEFLRRL